MYRILIIEDDSQAQALLKGYVERYLEENDIDAVLECAPSAFEFLEFKKRYDLVFMDIDLPGINGMQAAHELREHDSDSVLIFVTDLAKLAVKGYEVDALDFVVKPVSYAGISMRLDRAMRTLASHPSGSVHLSTRGGLRVFPANELLYVEVHGHDLVFKLKDGTDFHMRGTLRGFIDDISLPQLIQISSGCMVNADFVRSIDGQELTMSNGDLLVMSRPKRKEALESFARYYGGGR